MTQSTLPNKVRHFSPREGEVYVLLRAGLSTKEIAQRLGVATNTVKVYIHAIYTRLGITGQRGQARVQLPPYPISPE